MECSFCKCEADCTEVYKWEGEKEQEVPEQVCNACFREMNFIERIQSMSEERLKELRDGRTPCEIYSRVCGYMRPVASWNEGKKAEYEDRKSFKVEG